MIEPDVPDPIDVRAGVDTDRDGRADTLLLPDPMGTSLAVDLDTDGLADLLVTIDPSGAEHRTPLPMAGTAWLAEATVAGLDSAGATYHPDLVEAAGWGTDPDGLADDPAEESGSLGRRLLGFLAGEIW